MHELLLEVGAWCLSEHSPVTHPFLQCELDCESFRHPEFWKSECDLLLDHSSESAIESLLVCSFAVTDWGELSDCEHAECVDALGVLHAVPIATISFATCTASMIAVRYVRTSDRSS